MTHGDDKNALRDTKTVIVFKLDAEGKDVWRYPGQILERGDTWIRLEAYFDRSPADLGPVVFNRGDKFIETFYSDRWYNVFAVYAGKSGPLKGWYCNVCRPAEIDVDEHVVRCEDLALDLWVSPSGESQLLDEEEFAALSLTEEDRRQARAAAQQIVRLAAEKRLPTS
ncbi:MAG TPA: DUF402 domain-containing protein [Candidatus Binatia bacterium]|nr:DUF402 domain-containing protein [Candidatus Binatia bacterium]